MTFLNISELRKLYSEGGNIMAALRKTSGKLTNSTEAVRVSYDLQSGSYTEAWQQPSFRRRHDLYSSEIADIISAYNPSSLLEAGVGEATTLCSVLSCLPNRPSRVAGFDLSWSRVKFAREHALERGFPDISLCTGSLEHIPYPDCSFDLVYTAHAIEPNHGREKVILRELLRVARRFLLLFEPSYELGGDATKARIMEHGYCRDLPRFAKEEGGRILVHRLLDHSMNPENATALLALAKSEEQTKFESTASEFACPRCRSSLIAVRQNLYCARCAHVFPVLDEISCLLPENGILATFYADSR